jgi:hypothetical protein
MTAIPGPPPVNGSDGLEPARWLWFAAWAGVGLLFPLTLLGAFTIGLYMLPLAAAGTILLGRSSRARVGVVGLVSGFGLPLLWVAYLNRSGPGLVCVMTATSSSCQTEWSPWPWLVLGLVPTAAGVVLFRRQRARQRTALPPSEGARLSAT